MITKVEWSGSSHKEWLNQRRNVEGVGTLDTVRFGASDIGTIIGVSKYKCKRRLFYQMIGLHSNEWRTETSVAGHLQEPVVSSMWESWSMDQDEFLLNLEQGEKLRKTKKAEFFLLNDKYPNIFCSIDRLHDGETFSPFTGNKYDELTPIELKTTQSAYYKLWENGITDSYFAQITAQMMLSETDVAVFCTLVSGAFFHVKEFAFDKTLAEHIDHETRQFAQLCIAGKQIVDLINSAKSKDEKEEYQAMLEDITPDATALDDEQDLNKELFSKSEGVIRGDENDFKLLIEYQLAHDQIKAYEEVKQQAKNRITTIMKDAEVMQFEQGIVTWRRADGKRDYFSLKIDK